MSGPLLILGIVAFVLVLHLVCEWYEVRLLVRRRNRSRGPW